MPKFDVTENSKISILLGNMKVTVWSESFKQDALGVEPRDEEGLAVFH